MLWNLKLLFNISGNFELKYWHKFIISIMDLENMSSRLTVLKPKYAYISTVYTVTQHRTMTCHFGKRRLAVVIVFLFIGLKIIQVSDSNLQDSYTWQLVFIWKKLVKRAKIKWWMEKKKLLKSIWGIIWLFFFLSSCP